MEPWEWLVPIRFLTTVGQLLGTLAIAFDREPHVTAGLARLHTPEDYIDADYSFLVILGLSIVLASFELVSLFCACSLFDDAVNKWHCWLHGFGVAAVTAFTLSSAHYGHFWRIFCIASVLPLCAEMWSLLGIFWLHHEAY